MFFANILSQSLDFLLILTTLPFAEQKFFNFNEVRLLNYISLMDHTFDAVSKASPPYPGSSVLPTVISKDFYSFAFYV